MTQLCASHPRATHSFVRRGEGSRRPSLGLAVLVLLAACGPGSTPDDAGEGSAGTENPSTTDTGNPNTTGDPMPLSCDEITDRETCNAVSQDGEMRDCQWFDASRVQLNEGACAREESGGFCSDTWTGEDGCPSWETCADSRTVFYRYDNGAVWLTKMYSCDVPSGWDGACGFGTEPDECSCACEDMIFD